jgi:hypothetical protein
MDLREWGELWWRRWRDCGGGTGSCGGGHVGAAVAQLKQHSGRSATAEEGAGLTPALLEGSSARGGNFGEAKMAHGTEI